MRWISMCTSCPVCSPYNAFSSSASYKQAWKTWCCKPQFSVFHFLHALRTGFQYHDQEYVAFRLLVHQWSVFVSEVSRNEIGKRKIRGGRRRNMWQQHFQSKTILKEKHGINIKWELWINITQRRKQKQAACSGRVLLLMPSLNRQGLK